DNDKVIDELDPDKDNDCIPDEWETTYGLDPLDINDKYKDLDGDGVDNKNEYDTSTDPTNPEDYAVQMKENISNYGVPLCFNASFLYGKLNESDFDDDGIPDEMEIDLLMDPVNPEDAWMDYNGDGKSNKVQLMDENTDPLDSPPHNPR
ncbi:MAG: hypothetical protein ACMUFK_01855, partial [Thermoplasmatota archaeon]